MMQLLDAANFKRDTPLSVADFMNFVEKPAVRILTDDEIEMHLKGIFGV